jgi:hypothetical protein
MANSSGKPVLLDISSNKYTTSTTSHLLKRASTIDRTIPFTAKTIDQLMVRLPHIRSIVFDPSKPEFLVDEFNGIYNLNTYKGPNHEGVLADLIIGRSSCPPIFEEYMGRIFPNYGEREFMYRWLARTVVRPEYKIRTAPLLRGEPGTGKGVFVDVITSALAGKHNVLNTKLSEITGNFNSAISRCTVCCLDETYCQKKSSADKLKKFITDEYVTITEKHKDSVQATIYANIIILSNDNYPLYIEDGDRRYFVTKYIVHKQDKVETAEFVGKLIEWFNFNGGLLEVYKYLQFLEKQNSDIHNGFVVATETNSHSEIKTIDLLTERVGELGLFLNDLNETSILSLKNAFPFMMQPTIVNTLKEQGFKHVTKRVNGVRCRRWVKKNIQSTLLTPDINDEKNTITEFQFDKLEELFNE